MSLTGRQVLVSEIRVRAFSSTPGGLPHGTPGAGLAEPAAMCVDAAPGVPRGRALPGAGDE